MTGWVGQAERLSMPSAPLPATAGSSGIITISSTEYGDSQNVPREGPNPRGASDKMTCQDLGFGQTAARRSAASAPRREGELQAFSSGGTGATAPASLSLWRSVGPHPPARCGSATRNSSTLSESREISKKIIISTPHKKNLLESLVSTLNPREGLSVLPLFSPILGSLACFSLVPF